MDYQSNQNSNIRLNCKMLKNPDCIKTRLFVDNKQTLLKTKQIGKEMP